MNKPFTLIVNETRDNIVKEIEKSNIPVYCLKQILNEIFVQLDSIEKDEINKYNDSIKKKGNDKNAKD